MKDSKARRVGSRAQAIALAAMAGRPPVALSAPQIQGEPIAGKTVTGIHGDYPSTPTSFAMRWLRDGVPIANATAATYLVTNDDEDHKLTFEETPTLAGQTGAAVVSSELFIPVTFDPPEAPTIALTPGPGQIAIAITDGATGGASISGHRIFRGLSPDTLALVTTIGAVTSFTDVPLTPGKPYFFAVTAINAAGLESDLSAVVSAAPAAAGLPSIWPGAAWTGSAGSGFAQVPVDPVRVTAKPALRQLIPHGRRFDEDLLIGVTGGTHNNGDLTKLGIAKVRVHCEGRSIDIVEPTFQSFTDANGLIRKHFGWWATLKFASFSGNGDANVYYEAFPIDPTMQNRVTGPFVYHRETVRFDADVVIAPSQVPDGVMTFATGDAALKYFADTQRQNPRMTFVEPGLYSFGSIGRAYAGKGFCTIRATVPVRIGFPTYTTDSASTMRCGYDGLRFQGSNISIDYANVAQIYNEGLKDHWLDGCREINSRGRDGVQALWRKGVRPVSQGVRNLPWRTEVESSNINNPFTGSRLIRNCVGDRMIADILSDTRCVEGLEAFDNDDTWWNNEIDALDVQYTGANATGTIALLDAANPTLIAGSDRATLVRLTDSEIREFTISPAEAAIATKNYDVADLAAWINAQPGWTARILDDTRRATALTRAGLKGTGFFAIDAKTAPVRLRTRFDIHADGYQVNNPGIENVVVKNVRGAALGVQALLLGITKDFFVANVCFMVPAQYDGLSFSQLHGSNSNLVLANVSLTQEMKIRSSFVDGGYNLISNCIIPRISVETAGNIGLRVQHSHLYAGGTLSPKVVDGGGNTAGGNRASLWTNADAGDFSPAGELLANPKSSTLAYDIAGAARGASAPAGAAAGAIGVQAVSLVPTIKVPTGAFVLREDATAGDLAGTLGNLTDGATVSIPINGDAGGRVSISGAAIRRGAVSLDYETSTSHPFSVRTTLWTARNGPSIDTPFVLSVTDVPETTGPTSWFTIDDMQTLTGRTVSGWTMELHTGVRKARGAAGVRLTGTGVARQPAMFKPNVSSADPADWGVIVMPMDFGGDPATNDLGYFRPAFQIGSKSYGYSYDSAGGSTGYNHGNIAGRGKRLASFAADRFRLNNSWTGEPVTVTGPVAKELRLYSELQATSAYVPDIVLGGLIVAKRHKPIVINTWDDINLAQYTQLFPEMQKRGLLGTLYIPWNALGSNAAKMTEAMVREMVQAGWDAALDSAPLDEPLLAYPTAAAVLDNLADGRTKVGQLFGTRAIDHLCYSYGSITIGPQPITATKAAHGLITDGSKQIRMNHPNGFGLGINPGMTVQGVGVLSGTTVAKVISTILIELNQAVPPDLTQLIFTAKKKGVVVTCDGSPQVKTASTEGLVTGMTMTAAGVAAGATITVADATTFFVSVGGVAVNVPTSCTRANFDLKSLPMWGANMMQTLLDAGYKSGRTVTQAGNWYTGFGLDPKQAMHIGGPAFDGAAGPLIAMGEQAIAECGDLFGYAHGMCSLDWLNWQQAKRDAGLIDVMTVSQWWNTISARPPLT